MSRKKAWRTTDCKIAIRRNALRYDVSKVPAWVWYRYGAYYPRTSTIGLRFTRWTAYDMTDEDVEKIILDTLLHEMNHWASYLLLDRSDWIRVDHGSREIPHDDRLIERIANYPLGGSECLSGK